MAQLEDLKRMRSLIDDLKASAETIRENLDAKREWLDEKSEKYQESEAGQSWQFHLDSVEQLLDDIDSLSYDDVFNG